MKQFNKNECSFYGFKKKWNTLIFFKFFYLKIYDFTRKVYCCIPLGVVKRSANNLCFFGFKNSNRAVVYGCEEERFSFQTILHVLITVLKKNV